ncbi:MAG: hypothetical protein N3A59_07510 [Thermodesulfovibrionales bacterium]|nr:hypothetical protein [Thermodesulfovibrionales bacterium]
MSERIHIDIKEIKKLALKFSPEQLETCINQQIQEGNNVCEVRGNTDYVISELAKAEYVKELMQQGLSLKDAVRMLAQRIRSFHQATDKS